MQPLMQPATSMPVSEKRWRTLEEAKERLERRYLIAVLRRSRGCVAAAARRAGRDRSFFHVLLRKHGLDPKAFKSKHRRSCTVSERPSSIPTPPAPRPVVRTWFGVPLQ